MQETKIFDPGNGFAPLTDPWVITDSTLAKREGRWWMFLAGKITGREGIQLVSASLPEGAPLAATGWALTPDPQESARVAMLAAQDASARWDLKGGRHCPAYVKGGPGVERIYYAGGAENVWGPYTIGYLEWDGAKWADQPAPVFVATEEWERGSVYEPNLIYDEGLWKMWYVAGSNQENYLVHGYAESADGRTWDKRQIFAPPEEKIFDFCVIKTASGYEAAFSRVWLDESMPPANTGLWWTKADRPHSRFSEWSKPVQIKGLGRPWKPSLQYGEDGRMFVFFDGAYDKFMFTLSCLELERPATAV